MREGGRGSTKTEGNRHARRGMTMVLPTSNINKPSNHDIADERRSTIVVHNHLAVPEPLKVLKRTSVIAQGHGNQQSQDRLENSQSTLIGNL